MENKFEDKRNTMVLTTKQIVERKHDVLLVSHDEDDGMWEFLDGEDVSEENAAIVSLGEIINIDPTVNSIADLPLGWIACRDNIQEEWIRNENRN